MLEAIAILIFATATLAVAYILGLAGMLLTSVYFVIDDIPSWIWTMILIGLTIATYVGLRLE